jgi:hypothetical protein
MRRTSLILALALAAGACSSDSADDKPVDPSRERLHIVSGDQQTAPVIGTPLASASVAGLSLQQSSGPITEADLFPGKLVVRAVVTGGASQSESPFGPSLNVVAGGGAAGVSVTWRARPEGCGYPVEVSTITDSKGESVNRWVRGTLATTCSMDVCRVIKDTGEVLCDQTYTAVQEPGAAVAVDWKSPAPSLSVSAGDTLDISHLLTGGRDQHGNPADVANVVANISARTAWSPASAGGQVCGSGQVTMSPRDGWLAIVPVEAEGWTPVMGFAACLHMWIGNVFVGAQEVVIK